MKKQSIRSAVIKELYGTSLRFLLEQDAPPPADDPTAAAAPPTPDPAAAPAPDPTAGATPPATPMTPPMTPPGTPAAAPPGAPPAAPPGPKPPVDPESLNDPIDKFIVGAEKRAIDSAKGGVTEGSFRSLRLSSMSFLMEADDPTGLNEPDLDIETFTGEIKRLILNYDSLIDIKGMVIKKAKEYLEKNYPKSASSLIKDMDRLLKMTPNLSLDEKEPPTDHYAAQAGKASGGGAA